MFLSLRKGDKNMSKIRKIKETETGRNIMFQDIDNHHIMSRQELVDRIKKSDSVYNNFYYVRKINGIDTPVSKPDGNKKNNLG